MAQQSFDYEFEELPLVIEGGFEAADISGTATISYFADGEWGIEAIYMEGAKRNHWTIEDYWVASQTGKTLPAFDRKPVALDRGTTIHGIIHDRLENEWESKVQDAVNEQIAEDRQCAADDAADHRRDSMIERVMFGKQAAE